MHGIKFDVTDRSRTSSGTVIHPSGDGEHFTIMDCWIYGHRACATGIWARATNGLVVKRCILNGFTDYGLAWMAYAPTYSTDMPAVPPVIEDVDVSTVYRTPKNEMDGTGEAGIWAGTKSKVSRFRITDCSWMGLWTGANCVDAVFSDITINDITPSGTGIYVEHKTQRCVFERFQIGPIEGTFPWEPGNFMRRGFTTEWWANHDYNHGASLENVFRDGTINASIEGFGFEDALDNEVANVRFLNQSNTCIRDFRTSNAIVPKNSGLIWENNGNDFSGRLPGADIINGDHRPMGFIVQPMDVVARVGDEARFECEGSGGYSSYRYQWQKNRQNISGATNRVLTFTVRSGDNGSTYRCIATNDQSSITSLEAKLTIGAPTRISEPQARPGVQVRAMSVRRSATYDLRGQLLVAATSHGAGIVVQVDRSGHAGRVVVPGMEPCR